MTKLRPEPAYWILAGGRGLCLSMISTASMVYQIHRVGLNPLQLVLVGTTLELSVFLFEVPTGVVADVSTWAKLNSHFVCTQPGTAMKKYENNSA